MALYRWLFAYCLFTPAIAYSGQEKVVISVEKEALRHIRNYHQLASYKDIAIIEVESSQVDEISNKMHEEFHKCGGFVWEDDANSALSQLQNLDNQIAPILSQSIDQKYAVTHLLAEVEEGNIRASIMALSGFRNRYYKSTFGTDSQKWVYDTWAELVSHRQDVQIEWVNHTQWSQPSVILTFIGQEFPDEIVVIGGHGDSITSRRSDEQSFEAPGADDNASGIATITEVIRVAAERNVSFKRTVKFMSYAAEEVGLRGSKDIAEQFKAQGRNVIGVMQFDMTNFRGSNVDMTLITDNTHPEQNTFVKKLISTYLPGLRYGEDRCGYACSDHASWHRAGYPASFPFESTFNGSNPVIHTTRDLISQSGSTAQHAVPFAKLGLAFAIEKAKTF